MATKTVKAIPDNYHVVTPYMAVRNAAAAIEFYQKAFGAEQMLRMDGPNNSVMHAEIRIGDSVIMLGDEAPEMDAPSPQTLGGSTGGLMIYCEDVDAMCQRAKDAGAEVVEPPTDMFWGDRFARLRDPFGHRWSIATHVRDVPLEEMQKAQEEWIKANTPQA